MPSNRKSQNIGFSPEQNAVVIEHLSISDEAVTREARRWTSGVRGPEVEDDEELAAADLTPFVTQAFKLGAMAISATGAEQDRFGIERLVNDLTDKAVESTNNAADSTERAMKDATEAMTKASEQTRKARAKAEMEHRKQLNELVRAAKTEFNSEIERLVGGEHPELLDRLQPLLDKFGTNLRSTVGKQTEELLAKVAKQFDSADPSSPMAQQSAKLTEEQKKLVEQLGKNHADLAAKVDDLATAIKVRTAAHEAKSSMAKVTPIKGGTFENQANSLLEGIATGLGDEYADTRTITGGVARSKKGDGVLTVEGGSAQAVLEMTDSSRTGWNGYLEIAERNRDASASLGLVRTQEQNAGQAIRILGSRRIVMAFDPATDDAGLLRTVVILLRTAAIAASGRHGVDEVATAEEKISEALEQLTKVGKIKKDAGSIRKNADAIGRSCDDVDTGIRRLFNDALVALGGHQPEVAGESTGPSSQDGAA